MHAGQRGHSCTPRTGARIVVASVGRQLCIANSRAGTRLWPAAEATENGSGDRSLIDERHTPDQRLTHLGVDRVGELLLARDDAALAAWFTDTLSGVV